MLRLVGIRRSFEPATRAFRTVSSFHEASVTWTGDASGELWINDIQGLPTYWEGILVGAIELVHKRGSAPLRRTVGRGGVFEVSWATA